METKLIPTVEINGEHIDYQHLNIEHIIAWCKANNEVKWLKEIASKKVEYKIYPKVKGEDGKMRVDKTQKPNVEVRSISFIQLKIEFVEKFMPELKPAAKAKKVSMFDLIAAL